MTTKKLFSLFSVLLSMFGTNAFAYDFSAENSDGITIYYTYINNGTELEVTNDGSTGSSNRYKNVLAIPEEVTYMNRTRKVTSIGYGAFRDCRLLTSVSIPNSMTSIGGSAFDGCTGLTSIIIPDNVITIGNEAFDGCTGLTSVSIGNSVTTIGEYAFNYCNGLSTVIIPNSVITIEDGAFHYCTSLTSLSIGDNVTTIGKFAFSGCLRLSSLTIPSNLTSIGEYAFSGCDFSVVISKLVNVFNISESTFSDNTFYNATLYVPIGCIDKYKGTNGWKKFAFIEEGTSGGDTPPELSKCEKPLIGYSNGKLTFNCSTEGVTYLSTITDTDIASYATNEVQLGVTYNISVYATKAGYKSSDVVIATLCWIDVNPKTEGIVDGVANVAAKAVLIQSNDGVLSIEGIDDGELIKVYSIDGKQVGSVISNNGKTIVNTNLPSGNIAIVKIGQKSVKLIIN